MMYRRRRNRSPRIEFLETRETPSSLAGGPFLIHPLAVSHRPAAFHVSGSATVIGSPDSGVNPPFTAAATGQASQLGAFTGFFSVASPSDGGAQIQLQMNGKPRKHHKHQSTLQITMTVLATGSGGSPIDFQGTYAITSGTGRLARAVGGGSVTGIVNPPSLSLTFDLEGTIVR
jgi:hypothetical protein